MKKGDNRSVMPLDVRGCMRATLKALSVSCLKRPGNPLNRQASAKNKSCGIDRSVNDANRAFDGVTSMTHRAPDLGNRESLGSRGSMVAKLKLKGIDGRAPPGVEPAA